MEKITKNRINKFINSIAYLKEGEEVKGLGSYKFWASKIDGSYITHEGNEEDVKWMIKYGITQDIQSCLSGKEVSNIGFNPVEQKWYGWSHRAVFGFGIGSKVTIDSAGYVADNEANFIKKRILFWQDEYSKDISALIVTNDKGVKGVQLTWVYDEKVPNEKMRGTVGEIFCQFPDKWGKGEWVAESLSDAKQMAIDFAKDVS